jgi:hypothetical protein
LNTYATIAEVQEITGSVYSDAMVLAALESASREVDGLCYRHFWTNEQTRHYDVPCLARGLVSIDDLISATSVSVDDDGDGTYSQPLVAGTDYELLREGKTPKTFLRTLPWLDHGLITGRRTLRITGTWGYGDGNGNVKRRDNVTATVADATAEAITLSSNTALVVPGNTLFLGDEQVFIRARTTTTITATRGVNGTTATAHAAVPVFYAVYPAPISAAVRYIAAEVLRTQSSAGLKSVRIGQYSETAGHLSNVERVRLISQFRRYQTC